jgi:hypothetical protein
MAISPLTKPQKSVEERCENRLGKTAKAKLKDTKTAHYLMQPIIVRRLRVESISDPTPDPYGQSGFSALTAYVDDNDAALSRQLQKAAIGNAVVVVRCATLEAEGRVTSSIGQRAVSIRVDDLRYFKPPGEVSVERRNLPRTP